MFFARSLWVCLWGACVRLLPCVPCVCMPARPRTGGCSLHACWGHAGKRPVCASFCVLSGTTAWLYLWVCARGLCICLWFPIQPRGPGLLAVLRAQCRIVCATPPPPSGFTGSHC